MTHLDRRSFLAAGAAISVAPYAASSMESSRRAANRPVVIASDNGKACVETAMAALQAGAHVADAVVAGVKTAEDDPNDMTVGYGGLPNAEGVVQLDASVMDGRLHKAGSVAAIENIKNPAAVALKVLRETDHVMIVGEGARRFAIENGFSEEPNMLTPRAREAWLRWRRNANPHDDWLDDDQILHQDIRKVHGGAIPHTWGTIHCSAVDLNGDIAATTTTSGLSWKIPGRVGDSPIIGAGMFVDNAVGAAGATGRGEAAIQSCGAFQTVQHMASGMSPQDACLATLRWVATHTKRPDLLNDRGEPNFGLYFYALNKNGEFGAANMRGNGRFAVHDAGGFRFVDAPGLFT